MRSSSRAVLLVLLMTIAMVPITGARNVKLTFFAGLSNPWQIALFEEDMGIFEAEHPGVSVELINAATFPEGSDTRLMAMIAGGVAPDVFWTNGAGSYAAEGLALPTDKYIQRDRMDRLFHPVFMNARRGMDGLTYGLPDGTYHFMMYYNTALFDAAGLMRPGISWAFDDLLRAARVLTRDLNGDGEVDQWGILPITWTLYPWIFPNGGQWLDENEYKFVADDPRTIEALELLKQVLVDYNVSPTEAQLRGAGFDHAMRAFLAGRGAMIQEGLITWWAEELNAFLPGSWDVTSMPVGPSAHGEERFMASVGGGMTIYSGTEHPDEAWELVKFISTRCRVWNPNFTQVSRRPYDAVLAQYPFIKETRWFDVQQYVVPRTQGWPVLNPYLGSAGGTVNSAARKLVAGTGTAAEFREAVKQANRIMAQTYEIALKQNLTEGWKSAIRKALESL